MAMNEGGWDSEGSWDNDENEWDVDASLGDEPTSNNPLVPAAQVAEEHSPPVQPGVGKTSLVAQFDENGHPFVAKAKMVNGQLVQEKWRRPTPDEYNAIMLKAKIVRGGVVGTQVPAGTNLVVSSEKTPLGSQAPAPRWKKPLIYGAIGVGVLGAGYGIWRWRKGKK